MTTALTSYMHRAATTAIYPQVHAIPYLALGLFEEAGEYEVASDPSELGDVLWYWLMLCKELGLDPDAVAAMPCTASCPTLLTQVSYVAQQVAKHLRDGSAVEPLCLARSYRWLLSAVEFHGLTLDTVAERLFAKLAHRWGKEFQGNIFCIDPDRADLWGPDGPPRKRARQPIRRTTDDVLREPAELVQFINDRSPLDVARKRPEFEWVFSYLAGIHVRYGSLLAAPWAGRYAADRLGGLADAVKEAVGGLSIEPGIIARNPGISPFALDDLLKRFREREGDVEELLPADPASNDAAKVYAGIFGRLCRRACPNLGPEGGRAYMLALLVTRWMRGFSLSRLIQDRIDYVTKQNKPVDEAVEIRTVMNEVEQIARFEAPRGLNCYCDVLRQHLREVEREDLLEQFPLFSVFLELGVNQQTQIALIGIGLSRTSTVAVSELITSDSLTEPQVLRWLERNRELWSHASLPALVKRELERVLEQHKTRSGVEVASS